MEKVHTQVPKKRDSIDDILPYIVSEKTQVRDIREGLLETVLLHSASDLKKENKRETIERIISIENIIETKTRVRQHEEKAIVKYSFFIAAGHLEKYDSVEIRYAADKKKEEMELRIKEEKKEITLQIEKQKETNEEYSILFEYSPKEKGYRVEYIAHEYRSRIEKARQDFTNRIDKSLDLLPKSLMGGILGFTYLGSGKMTRRDDLFGDKALMVDVHEAIHTPDEYETRILTDWMLTREKQKYLK